MPPQLLISRLVPDYGEHEFSHVRPIMQRLVALDGSIVSESPAEGGATHLLAYRDDQGAFWRRAFRLDRETSERAADGTVVTLIYREDRPPEPMCWRCGRVEAEHE